jgi:RNA polymerase sigma-70 factor (ECF subfamily)
MGFPLQSIPTEASAGATTSHAPASFEDFFRDHHPRLFAALCLTTGSRHEAEEIAQEAFVRVLERWERVSSLENPGGYLFQTGMNLFRKRYRRARLWERLQLPTKGSDDAFATVDDRDVLVRALRGLTPRQRAAVVLTTILDYPSEEAARIMGISDSTVRVLAKRARAELRTTMGDEA